MHIFSDPCDTDRLAAAPLETSLICQGELGPKIVKIALCSDEKKMVLCGTITGTFDTSKVMFKVEIISADVFAYCDVELVGEAVLASSKSSCCLDTAAVLVYSSPETAFISDAVLALSEVLIVLDIYVCRVSVMNGKRVTL
jgi:hypothetical protein